MFRCLLRHMQSTNDDTLVHALEKCWKILLLRFDQLAQEHDASIVETSKNLNQQLEKKKVELAIKAQLFEDRWKKAEQQYAANVSVLTHSLEMLKTEKEQLEQNLRDKEQQMREIRRTTDMSDLKQLTDELSSFIDRSFSEKESQVEGMKRLLNFIEHTHRDKLAEEAESSALS